MISQITNNNNEIESYYDMGSIHADIRILLNNYIYNDITCGGIVDLYSKLYGEVLNLNMDFSRNTIIFDIRKNSLNFKKEFAHCMYSVISNKITELQSYVDLFEKENKKFVEHKDKISSFLNDESYYITLFRTTFIKHEDCTSCIIQL